MGRALVFSPERVTDNSTGLRPVLYGKRTTPSAQNGFQGIKLLSDETILAFKKAVT